MEKAQTALRRAVKSGTVSGLATAAVASLAGKCEGHSYAAPLNATSHIVWGEKAAKQDSASIKYTLTGFLLNHASAIFWASFYEKLLGERNERRKDLWGISPASEEPMSVAKPVLGGAAVAAAAYIIDYHLIPKRFTPGFEKRLSGKSLAGIFATLAAGLATSTLLDRAANHRKLF